MQWAPSLYLACFATLSVVSVANDNRTHPEDQNFVNGNLSDVHVDSDSSVETQSSSHSAIAHLSPVNSDSNSEADVHDTVHTSTDRESSETSTTIRTSASQEFVPAEAITERPSSTSIQSSSASTTSISTIARSTSLASAVDAPPDLPIVTTATTTLATLPIVTTTLPTLPIVTTTFAKVEIGGPHLVKSNCNFEVTHMAKDVPPGQQAELEAMTKGALIRKVLSLGMDEAALEAATGGTKNDVIKMIMEEQGKRAQSAPDLRSELEGMTKLALMKKAVAFGVNEASLEAATRDDIIQLILGNQAPGYEHLQIACNGRVWGTSDPLAWFNGDSVIASVGLDAAYSVPFGGVALGLMERLQHLPKLVFLSLKLGHVDWYPQEVQEVLVGIGKIPQLQNVSLDLSSIGIFRNVVTSIAISQSVLGVAGLGALGNCARLTSLSLNIGANDLAQDSIRELSLGLARLSNLRDLIMDVSMNRLQDVGAWELGGSLKRLRNIESLSIRAHLCSISAAGLMKLLFGLSRLGKLSSLVLDVSFNDLTGKSATNLAVSRLISTLGDLAEQSLQKATLSLSGTGLDRQQIHTLAKELEKLERKGLEIKLVVDLQDSVIREEAIQILSGLSLVKKPSEILYVLRLMPKTYITSTTRLESSFETPSSTSQIFIASSPVPTSIAQSSPSTSSSLKFLPQRPQQENEVRKPTSSAVQQENEVRKTTSSAVFANSPFPDLPTTSWTVPDSQGTTGTLHGEATRATTTEEIVVVIKDVTTTDNEDIQVGNKTNSSSLGTFDSQSKASLDTSLALAGLIICIGGFALLYGGHACANRSRSAQRDDARMSMLGTRNSQTSVTTQAFASAGQMPRSTSKRNDNDILKDDHSILQNSKADDDEGSDSFANFGSFPEAPPPVVQNWTKPSSSSSNTRKNERADSANSDSLEAILEAQVAALGDGEHQDEAPDGFAPTSWPNVPPQHESSSGNASSHLHQQSIESAVVPKLASSTKPGTLPKLSAPPKVSPPRKSSKAGIPQVVPKFSPPTAAPTSVTPKFPMIAPPR